MKKFSFDAMVCPTMVDENPESTDVSISLWKDSHTFTFVEKIAVLISTFFLSGLLPIAPGTWASLFAVCIYPLFAELAWKSQLQIIIITTLIGVFAISKVQKKTGGGDDGRFVIDEVVGMWITVATFPVDWMWLTLGFFVFRALDIWKPFPARHIDKKFHGAWGVMLDDIIAGIYGLAILKVIEALLVFI